MRGACVSLHFRKGFSPLRQDGHACISMHSWKTAGMTRGQALKPSLVTHFLQPGSITCTKYHQPLRTQEFKHLSPQGTVHIQDTIKLTKVVYVKFLGPDSNRNSRDITRYYYSLNNKSLRTELGILVQFPVACLGSLPVDLVFDTFNSEM